jgi:hypothetical protein
MTHPSRHPYDPGDPYPERTFDGDCPLLVLLAAPDADAEWAAQAALSLARQWADRGERVFLADLAFSRPRLHGALGMPNGEGMSDLFLYGASLRRIARVAPDGFFFASAGTPITSGRKVLRSTRWGVLTRGFAKAGAHLVVFLPSDEPGSSEVLSHAERVLLLSGPNGQKALDAAGPSADRVAGVYSPRTPRASGPAAAAGVAAAPGARGASAAAPAPSKPGASEPSAPKTYGKPKPKAAKTFSTGMILLLVAVGVLALAVVLALTGVLQLPWGPASTALDEPGATGEGSPGPAPAAADISGRSYFLTLGLYAEGVALLQAEQLGQRRPDLLFVVSPVEVDGQVLERLMVGETVDSTASALKASLARTLTSEAPDWLVRPGPLSYHLGTYETLEAADARLVELHGLDVPAFLLRQPVPSGADRFDVWAGAYADAAEAAYLGRTLNVQGIVPILVRRTGELLPE